MINVPDSLVVSCLWSPVTLPGERFFPQSHYTFSLTSDLHNRKLNPRFNDAEVFDIVKTSTDSVFPLQTENPVASMKHRDLSEQVSTNRKKLKMKKTFTTSKKPSSSRASFLTGERSISFAESGVREFE